MPLDIERIRLHCPQNAIHYFPTLPSTMTEAARLAEDGVPDRTVVLADEQTAGIGRLGRSWISSPELGIYCSVVQHLNLPPDSLPLSSLLIGLATSEAIHQATDLACDLRWPNDVLINDRKTAGILTHLVGNRVVAGIGINVNHPSLPFDLRTPATSLCIESGHFQSRERLVVELLHSIDRFCLVLENSGPESILRAFAAASSYVNERRVVIEDSGLKGTTAGLDKNGFLLLRLPSGAIDRISAGGVRPDLE
jgi:BirA family biotin operon repressor/biotin-[acetyl-CoA-carboxylase] ligase